MYQTEKIYISKRHGTINEYGIHYTELAKNLYNAALFRVRQIFTGYGKEHRSDNESLVFGEVDLLQKTYPSIKVRRVISYSHLEKLMRVTKNPDFFAGLPMQSAQWVLKEVLAEFDGWLMSLKNYKAHPKLYKGRPKMPGYLKGTRHTLTVTSQDAVIYPSSDGRAELKLPLIKERLCLPSYMLERKLVEAKIVPYYNGSCICLTYDRECRSLGCDYKNTAAVDLGLDNLAAIVCTDSSSRIYKGGALKDRNRSFNRERARAISIITRGHEKMHASSRHLDRLSKDRDCFFDDQLHKISRSIVSFCLEHKAGTLVIGTNKYWKQNIDLGASNNQGFVSMPLARLCFMIKYKAELAGIHVIEQEESYTSKADVTIGDYIPVYGKDDDKASFSGRRIKRGLYCCHNGLVVNADCNGAANILRKAYPEAWEGTKDFSFLSCPEVYGFHKLNRTKLTA